MDGDVDAGIIAPFADNLRKGTAPGIQADSAIEFGNRFLGIDDCPVLDRSERFGAVDGLCPGRVGLG